MWATVYQWVCLTLEMSRLAHEKLSQKAHKRFAHTGKKSTDTNRHKINTHCWLLDDDPYILWDWKLIAKTGLRWAKRELLSLIQQRFYLSRLLWKVFFVHSITVVILVLPRYLYNMYYTKSIDMENTVQVTYFSIYSPAPQHCRNYIHENDCVSSPAKSILTK